MKKQRICTELGKKDISWTFHEADITSRFPKNVQEPLNQDAQYQSQRKGNKNKMVNVAK